MDLKEYFKYIIKKIIGKEIWDFRLGESTGSIISFECGDKTDSSKEKSNVRKFEGESSFMIYCSWKISKKNKIITSWNDKTYLLKRGTSKLSNLKVLNVYTSNSFDLIIELEKGYELQVFCDKGVHNEFNCNWFYRDGVKYYSINNNGEIEIE